MAISLANKRIGDTVTLSNGAVAEVVGGRYVDNAANQKLGRVGQTYKKLKIVQGGRPPVNRARKAITKETAQVAFNRYWGARKRAAGADKLKLRGVAAARGRDLAYGRPAGLRSTTAYLSNPGRLEFEGVDFGDKRYKAPSAKQLAALAAGRAAAAGKPRAKPMGAARRARLAARRA